MERDSIVLGVGLVLADERNGYEKDRRGMQRNNQGEWCERLSTAQRHARKCAGLSALRDILDRCMDANPIRFCSGPVSRPLAVEGPPHWSTKIGQSSSVPRSGCWAVAGTNCP